MYALWLILIIIWNTAIIRFISKRKSHIDYLLKNINLTLEFDIPYASQIELKYLVKLKQLLYIAAKDNTCNVNISKLSGLIGVSRATVLNYLNYMKNARLLTLLYDTDNDDDCGKKPKKLYIHNPNLLNAVCLEDVDTTVLRKFVFSESVMSDEPYYLYRTCRFFGRR